jgi:hypothetical protein
MALTINSTSLRRWIMLEVGKKRDGSVYTADYVGQFQPFYRVCVYDEEGIVRLEDNKAGTTSGILDSRRTINGYRWDIGTRSDGTRGQIVADYKYRPDIVRYNPDYVTKWEAYRAEQLVNVMDMLGYIDRTPREQRWAWTTCVDLEHKVSRKNLMQLLEWYRTWPLHGNDVAEINRPLWAKLRLTN